MDNQLVEQPSRHLNSGRDPVGLGYCVDCTHHLASEVLRHAVGGVGGSERAALDQGAVNRGQPLDQRSTD